MSLLERGLYPSDKVHGQLNDELAGAANCYTPGMEPRISMITLGVSDLSRSVSFYKDILGLRLSPHSLEGAVAFFELNGTWLGLFGREELARDARVQNDGAGFDGVALAHNLKSEEEVKDFFEFLKGKGVPIAKQPVKADWGGFSGYFKDPDGHLWEVAYNPAFWIGPKSET